MDTTPVREVNAKLEALQKAGNAQGMGDMYTDDAVLLPSGGTAPADATPSKLSGRRSSAWASRT